MLRPTPVTEPLADDGGLVRVPMLAAVAINARGGWALAGWRGAAPEEMRQQVRLILDDPVGVIRICCLTVPVLTDEAMRKLLEG
jgi:hypothetical protein